MNTRFLRAFLNAPFIAGLAILVVGTGPLVLFGILQTFGFFPGNNGLGLGLLFFFSIWPALAFLIGGIAVGIRRVDGPADKHGAWGGRGRGAA